MKLNINEKQNNGENKKKILDIYAYMLMATSIIVLLMVFVADIMGYILGAKPIILNFSISIITAILALILGIIELKVNKRKTVVHVWIVSFCITVVTVFNLMVVAQVSGGVADKPIIYLYPEEETNVSVELPEDDRLLVSYPKYEESWKVLAKENGDLVDLETGRNLYSLYYENKNVVDFKVEKEGFVVKGEDTAKFLEEKLEILGLNEREAEEFIIYWLPKLEENKYNYIRFASVEEIEENMPLEISPKPDTTIRVLMTYKGLDRKIEVEEQKLETPKREGFVAVEWGGTEIK